MKELNYLNCRRKRGESQLKYRSVSRQLYRLRDKKYPKKPQTDEGIRNYLKKPEIMEEYGQTLDKQHPLYIDSVIKKEKYAFHVFASIATIEMIKNQIPCGQRKYVMDGTFKIIPKQFSKKGQLLILSIEYKNDVRSIDKSLPKTIYNYIQEYLSSRYSRFATF